MSVLVIWLVDTFFAVLLSAFIWLNIWLKFRRVVPALRLDILLVFGVLLSWGIMGLMLFLPLILLVNEPYQSLAAWIGIPTSVSMLAHAYLILVRRLTRPSKIGTSNILFVVFLGAIYLVCLAVASQHVIIRIISEPVLLPPPL